MATSRPQLLIPCTVYLPHAADTNAIQDFVGGDDLPRLQLDAIFGGHPSSYIQGRLFYESPRFVRGDELFDLLA